MESDNFSPFPQRDNPAAGVKIISSQPTFVFLTVKTKDHKPWLANPVAHEALVAIWTDAKAWLVSDYMIMPDHLHLFCAPHDLKFEIETWIKYWKSQFRKSHGYEDWKFQSRGWHHRLRHDESYHDKWVYMMENPVRKGLARRVGDWPYQGRVFNLRW